MFPVNMPPGLIVLQLDQSNIGQRQLACGIAPHA
jgi:hypothetical protein